MRFSGKVVLVTGGGSGIGAATCLAFAKEGADIAIFDMNIENAEEVTAKVRNMQRKARALKVDVSSFSAINACVQKVYEELEHIDVLINAAGYGRYVLCAEMSEEVWDRSIAVHLKGPFNCTRAVINGMIAQRSGKIVNISSTAGLMGTVRHVHYSAAKAGLIGMTKALARELAPYGINVNCVAPGSVDTPFVEATKRDQPEQLQHRIKDVPLARLGTPEEMAAIIVFLCSEDASYITGQVISPNGGRYI